MRISYIEDYETRRIFHIDADDRWVQREWSAFEKDSPGRYQIVRLAPSVVDLIDHARARKMIVPNAADNAYVPMERRAKPAILNGLLSLHLIQKVGKDEYRLTDDGEKIAAALVESES